MANDYDCASQQRLLKLIETMAGSEIDGQTAADLARKMEVSTTATFRDLQNLQTALWAEQLEDGRWRLTPNAARLLRRITDNINTAMRRINKVHQDYMGI